MHHGPGHEGVRDGRAHRGRGGDSLELGEGARRQVKQARGPESALELDHRGAHVVLSNASDPLIHKLYSGPDFRLREVPARRAVNADGAGRGPVLEVIITVLPSGGYVENRGEHPPSLRSDVQVQLRPIRGSAR